MGRDAPARRIDAAGLMIGIGLLILAAVIAWNGATLNVSGGYARIGPELAPFVVAAGLAILGIGTLVAAWRGDVPAREPGDPRAILLIVGGLVAVIALIGFGGGFITATAILFAATAR